MKLALIPPFTCMGAIGHTDYQMLLPQNLQVSEHYVNAYRRFRREGHFMMLDNGAAEGIETEPMQLNDWARLMMVHEIVVPDELGDVAQTLSLATHFQKYVDERFHYMGVVQGQDLKECYACIRGFTTLNYIRTIGVPRHLLTTIGTEARYHIVQFIRSMYAQRYNIHLLGTNPEFMGEFDAYGNSYRAFNVRGVDTSAPFNYAMEGVSLLESDKVVLRPNDYFHRTIPDPARMYSNVTIMKDWTYGNLNFR